MLICKTIISTGKGHDRLKADYENERHVLSSLRCLEHPSIIKLITAYSIGSSCNFLFPAADGDLKYFLSLEQRPPLLESDQSIFDAVWSLASAMQAMHSYFSKDFNVRQIGCHYDIKPGNILFSGHKFLLADFGLSRLRPDGESSQSLYKGVEGSYIAPECEPASEGFERARIGRSSDVWSFGCFLTELLAFMHRGPRYVQELYVDRRKKLGPHWAYYFHSGDHLDPAVEKYLADAGNLGPRSENFKSLSNVIKETLQMDPARRITSPALALRLFHLAQSRVVADLREIFLDQLSSTDLELKIEYLRLDVWASTLGLAYTWNDAQSGAWLMKSLSFEHLQRICDVLGECCGELKSLRCEQAINTPSSYHRCYHLQRLQDQLWDMLPNTTRAEMRSRLEDNLLKADEPGSFQDTTLLLLDPVPDDPDRRGHDVASGSAMVQESVSREIILLALMKRLALVDASDVKQGLNLAFDRSSLSEPFIEYHSHYLSTDKSSGCRVLIERMIYTGAWYTRPQELLQRVQAITYIRNQIPASESLRLLTSKGYYHEPLRHQYCIVYEMPESAKDTFPKSLHDLIEETQQPIHMPSLSRRFDLAIRLAESVLILHKAGWLHKNICSFNLICLPGMFSSKAASITQPWLIGFNYSRLNDATAFTQGPGYERALLDYQHPSYLESLKEAKGPQASSPKRFRQQFEYYSVGLVLLEIALWRPLQRIVRNVGGDPWKVKDHLLRHHMPIARNHMGDHYAAAIEACLSCYRGEETEDVESTRMAFETRVVLPIRMRRV